MLVAILYTGEFRTCFKTMQYTKQNILLNDDVHVFATIQNANTNECNEFITTNFGLNLKSLIHFNKSETLWNSIQDELLNKMSLPINTTIYNYLKKSGSMIEYYQLYLSYQSLLEYEKSQNIKYDYVVRLRTDVIYTQPLTFNFINLSILDIKEQLQIIKNITKETNLLSLKNIKILLNNLLVETNKILRYSANYGNIDFHSNSDNFNKILNDIENDNDVNDNENNILESIHSFLNNGKYIITLRKNVFFIIKRDWFSEIANLGITYGAYKNNNNAYWWNSESQLQEICLQNNITIFDSTILLEDNSLYKYNNDNYFNENNKLQEDLQCLFFICRS